MNKQKLRRKEIYLDARNPHMIADMGLSDLVTGSASTPKVSSAVAPNRYINPFGANIT
jgi:hypothetical protein